jgi:hypothetical protein
MGTSFAGGLAHQTDSRTEMTYKATPVEVELTAESLDDLDEVYDGLRGVPGITVTAVPSPPVPGAQGAALDVLVLALSSGAITTFLQIIKVLAESRGPKFSLKMRQGKNRLEVTADNLDEVLPLIRELLDGS